MLKDKDLKVGTVNEFYSDYISAEIKNEPYDNSYVYYFGVTGNLPVGLEWDVEHRKVFFEGIPLETGSFEFGGHTRDYLVYLPQNYQPNMPVVIGLHGYTENANFIKNHTYIV